MGQYYSILIGGESVHVGLSRQITPSTSTDWDCKRHNNADYELHFILKGSCVVEVENKRFPLRANEIILIPPGHYHQPTLDPGAFLRFSLSLSPPSGNLHSQLQALYPDSHVFPCSSEINAVCHSILRECVAADSYTTELLQAQLTCLMFYCMRTLNIHTRKTCRSEEKEIPYTDRIDSFFELNLENRQSAEDLAALLNISRRQLARILQQRYGMGFREKLLRTRMDRAGWLLRNTDTPVNNIAWEVGYASESAFYLAFRDHYHMTPAQYRNRLSPHDEPHPGSTAPPDD